MAGLFDEMMAYIQANTPRSTRPVAKPSTVINQGLLNPNKFNAPAANRLKDSAFGLLGVVPGVGDVASAAESADLFNRGEKFAGSVAALGALPLVPALGGIFIGKGAKTWDAIKASEAEQLLKQGIDPREVWKQTGTLKGVDGAFRQEIPDNLARMSGIDPSDEYVKAFQEGGMPAMKARQEELADYIRPYQDYRRTQDIDNVFEHSGLEQNYPDLFHYGKYKYDHANPRIGEGAYYAEKPGAEYRTDLITLSPANEPTARSGMLHELQHAIQQREGWARGGSPDQFSDELSGEAIDIGKRIGDIYSGREQADTGTLLSLEARKKELDHLLNFPYQSYKRLAGEAEARLTQSRMGLDAAQRLQHYPYDQGPYGLDVPLDSLIVRGLLDGPAMSVADDAGGLLGKVDNAPMSAPDFKVKPPKKLYRGTTDGKGYGTYMLGKGVYSSPDKSFAAKYGKVQEIDPSEAFPRNPLVIDYAAGGAPSVFADWVLEKTGLKNMREFNAKYPDPGEFIRSLGYDGVVIGDEIVKY